MQCLFLLHRSGLLPRLGLIKEKQYSKNRVESLLYFSHFNGGIGGSERLLKTFELLCIKAGVKLTVVYNQLIPNTRFTVVASDLVTTFSFQDWKDKKIPIDQDIFFAMDLVFNRKFWRQKLKKSKTFSIINFQLDSPEMGNYLLFDYVHLESGLPYDFYYPKLIFHPPVPLTVGPARVSVPYEDFYLTIYNPYGSVKGFDRMIEALDALDKKLVWCFDLTSFSGGESAENIKIEHPNLVKINAAPQELIYSLLAACQGYMCFSRGEGYGFSLADAVYFKKPICSGNVGIVKDFPDFEPTVDFKKPIFSSRFYEKEADPFGSDFFHLVMNLGR